jgi:predicted dehydrogenase
LRSTYGPILNQGPHQVDIVRQLGGGMVRSVRAQTVWDSLRGVEGGWICFLEFENGVPATLSYDARGFFATVPPRPTRKSPRCGDYSAPGSVVHQPFFGITIASCERGAMRQSRDGLIVYGDAAVTEVPLAKERRARAAEPMDMYDGIVHGRPLCHGGARRATLEVCLGMIESARTRAEVPMHLQVPT